MTAGLWYQDVSSGAAVGMRFRVLTLGADTVQVEDAFGVTRIVNRLRFEADMEPVGVREAPESPRQSAQTGPGSTRGGRAAIPLRLRYRREAPERPGLAYWVERPEGEGPEGWTVGRPSGSRKITLDKPTAL